MFVNPYSTTALAPQTPKGIVPELQAAMARRELLAVEGHPRILEVPVALRDIKPFFHPMIVESFGQDYVIIDTRSMVRESRSGERVVQNPGDYSNMVVRARLTYLWSVVGTVAGFTQVGDIPARTFTRVITDAIARRLGMQPADFLSLQIATAFYYYSLFRQPGPVSESDLLTVCNQITRITRIPANLILPKLEGAQWLNDVSEYCQFVKRILGNSRAENLNPSLLYTMLGGMWFGVDAPNVVRAALEFPPYWVAVCYTAAVDRSYNKSLIGKEIHTANQRNNVLGLFSRAVEDLMGVSDRV